MIAGIIPARLHSTRLPQKALINIDGLPMVIHVAKRASLCKSLDKVIVATDSKEIEKVVLNQGIECFVTKKDHQNGTDRMAEVVDSLPLEYYVIVNIQGDEPLLDPKYISLSIDALTNEYDATQPYVKCDNPTDPTNIKVVFNRDKEILYYSRSVIPSYIRDKDHISYKVVSISSFWRETVIRYFCLPQGNLEKIEFIEQLRLIENKMKIKGVELEEEKPSVDVYEDLFLVRELMKSDPIRKLY